MFQLVHGDTFTLIDLLQNGLKQAIVKLIITMHVESACRKMHLLVSNRYSRLKIIWTCMLQKTDPH